MSFGRITTARVSDSIAAEIEDLILIGVLKPGQKLAPERELAQTLQVSRTSLRDALVKLEARGLLQVRRGGAHVCDILAPTLTDPLVHLLKEHPEAMLDLLELRQCLEEVAAFFAAQRANEVDRKILTRVFERLAGAAAEPAEEGRLIAEFYLAIADASHNVALMHVMRGLFNLMRSSIAHSLERIHGQAGTYQIIHGYRQQLFAAVMQRDPEAARLAAHDLIVFVNKTLTELGDPQNHGGISFDDAALYTPAALAHVKPTRLSDAIVEHLERLLLRGRLKPGDRLPTEAEFAHQFGVSRVVVRDATAKLEARGLVGTRQGGGTFVTDVTGPTVNDPLVHLLHGHPDAVFDFLELRRSLESLAAGLAASRITPASRQSITLKYEALRESFVTPDPYDNAGWATDFHIALAEASRNVALVYVLSGLCNLLRTNIRRNLERLSLEPGAYDILRQHHKEICEAVLAGDAERARRAAHVHIGFVNQSLRQLGLEEKRRAQSERRLHMLGADSTD